MNIRNANVLVAGGSSGLGAACASRLAGLGARVIVADVRPPDSSLVQALGIQCVFYETDVTNEAAVRASLASVPENSGGIRGVVICAGVIHAERIAGRNGPFDLEAFRRVVDTNLVGTFNVLRLAAASMQHNIPDENGERGAIVMTSSVAAFEGQIGQAAYAASKGGVAALTLPAARELGSAGIRVMCIAPGVFDTPMMRQVPADYRQSLESQCPFPPRFGHPAEFADLVVHIMENPMLNGTVIRLDGGLRMAAR